MGSSTSTQQQSQSEPKISSASTEKKGQIYTKTNQAQNKQSQQSSKIITDKEITNIVQSISQKQQIKDTFLAEELAEIIQKQIQNNEILREYRKQKQLFDKQYLIPLEENYSKIPVQLTAFKFTYLNSYDYKDRLIVLGLFSMLFGVRSFKKAFIYQLPLRSFSAIKDSVVVYFLAGIFVAPEIYNPLMSE